MKSPSDIYLDSVLAPPWQILGLRMMPLCIGHLKVLEKLGVSNPMTVPALLIAVLVCHTPVEKIEQRFSSMWFELMVRIWCWKMGRKLRKAEEFLRQLGFFREYIASQTAAPGFMAIEQGGESQTPFCQGLRVALLSKLNYRPSEIDSTRVLVALWDLRALDEINGRIRYTGGTDGEFEREQAEKAKRFADDVESGRFKWR